MPERPDWQAASERLHPRRYTVLAAQLRPDDDVQRDMKARRLGSIACSLLAAAPDAVRLESDADFLREVALEETDTTTWIRAVVRVLRGEPTP